MNRPFSLSKNKNAGNKQWVHPPEALVRGHIVYHVKFLGHVEVDQPKGTEVVKDAIRKMKFNKQIRKAEGQKLPKVELTISVDGVTVQEPKFKVIQHQYPLHRISYCADDKSDKRMFTFIAKEADSNKHQCFVFDSEKCAEEITLTIGQAFDLAYKKFLESSGRDMDTKKQFLLLQKKVQQLTHENLELKARVADLERLIDPQTLENLDRQRNQLSTSVNTSLNTSVPVQPHSPNPPSLPKPPDKHAIKQGTVSPSKPQEKPVVGRKLENLLFEEEANVAPQSNGTAVYGTPGSHQSPSQGMPKLAPPPPVPNRTNAPGPGLLQGGTPQPQHGTAVDLFGSPPFNPATQPQEQSPTPDPFDSGFGTGGSGDPFGMGEFNPSASPQELDRQIQKVDQELMDLQAGFSQGLSFGTDDFSLDDLDPLKK